MACIEARRSPSKSIECRPMPRSSPTPSMNHLLCAAIVYPAAPCTRLASPLFDESLEVLDGPLYTRTEDTQAVAHIFDSTFRLISHRQPYLGAVRAQGLKSYSARVRRP